MGMTSSPSPWRCQAVGDSGQNGVQFAVLFDDHTVGFYCKECAIGMFSDASKKIASILKLEVAPESIESSASNPSASNLKTRKGDPDYQTHGQIYDYHTRKWRNVLPVVFSDYFRDGKDLFPDRSKWAYYQSIEGDRLLRVRKK